MDDLHSELSPILDSSQLEAAPLDRLQDQVRYELERLLNDFTQESLAHEIGYDSGSQVSKIMNGAADLPLAKARALDKRGYVTSLGTTFEDLVRAVKRGKGPTRGRPKRVLAGVYDVFLALPMASTADESKYQSVRREARQLVTALEVHCRYSVYCGAVDVSSRTEFDSPSFAINENIPALTRSRRFVLWVPELVIKPSSVWVEAGMALALGKPSTYLVPSPDVLPYILRQAAGSSGVPQFGTVKVHWIDSDLTPTSLVTKHGHKLFG